VDLIRRDLSRAVPECGQPAAIVLSFIRLLKCKLRQRSFWRDTCTSHRRVGSSGKGMCWDSSPTCEIASVRLNGSVAWLHVCSIGLLRGRRQDEQSAQPRRMRPRPPRRSSQREPRLPTMAVSMASMPLAIATSAAPRVRATGIAWKDRSHGANRFPRGGVAIQGDQ